MSIDPVATAQSWTAAKKAGAPGATPAVPFAELLSGQSTNSEVSAATAAQILRLKMLSSALSLGDEAPAQSGSAGVQALLDRFLEQLPKSATAGSAGVGGVEGDTVVSAGGALADAPSMDLSTEAIIAKASKRYGVDGGLIKAVIKAESNFNPRAVSSAGAQGLMQLMPATARGLGVSDSFDPEQNVMAGTRFLKDMLQRYGGNVDEALAAYNWGPGNVDRHGSDNLPRETRAYLGKVKGYYAQYLG